MKKAIGQSLRLGGMLLEMIGGMGVMTGKGDIASLRVRLSDGTLLSPAWLLFGVGLFLWLVGTILLASMRPTRPRP